MSAAQIERPPASRRAAALIALLALSGALITAVVGLFVGDAWRLIVVVLCLLVAILAAWAVVTRRGIVRLAGALIALAALVGAIAVLLTGTYLGLPLWIALVLLAACMGTARYAMRRDPKTLRAEPVLGTPVDRAQQPVLIMNPKSGGGKAERFALAEECRKRGIEPVALKAGDDLLQLAEDAIAGGADVIGMAGGDGSQALVASVASAHGVPHVVIPAGTRNHFALDLGLDREDVVGALEAFADGVERTIDLARVNGRVFVNNASLGIYAKIVQSDAYRDAKMKTAGEMLPEMLGPDAQPFDLRFTGPDGTTEPSAHMILVSNDVYQLEHLGGFGTRARLDLGTLGIVALRLDDAGQVARLVTLEAAGQVSRHPGWMAWDRPRFRVDSDAPIEIGIDGEALRMDPPLEFESLPGALRVRVPKTAPGYTPAQTSVPLSVTVIEDLFRVAFGRSPRTESNG
jgi:diacylglycerol kinase family enzyme